MTMRNYVIPFIAAIAIAAGCAGSGDNSSKAVGSSSINFKLDQAKFGLLGKVKTVTYDNYSLQFSPHGYLNDNDETVTRFNGRVRTDAGLSGMSTYTFDDLGRVISMEGMDYKADYSYEGDNYYPSSMTETSYDEMGTESTVTYNYSYSRRDFDSEGNWTARKENGKKITRTIEYYPDPYKLDKEGRYTSPEAVLKANWKARIKQDAELFLSTYEYKIRKHYEMTVESQENNFFLAEENGFKVLKYHIMSIEMRGDNEAKATIFVDYSGYESSDIVQSLYKADDGYWYSN